jgi:glycosyltransferase involved in cell wall biosynthesis
MEAVTMERTGGSYILLNIGVATTDVCGVRDYATTLGAELSGNAVDVHDVWTVTNQGHQREQIGCWLAQVEEAALAQKPDGIMLHYSVFSYSWKGVPIYIGRITRRLKALNVPVVTVLHEYAVPWGRRGLRGIVHAVTQRAALRPVIAVSTELVVTTSERKRSLSRQRLLPRRRITSIPVFSNVLPSSPVSAERKSTVVVFGYATSASLCGEVTASVAHAGRQMDGLQLVLLGSPGPDGSALARWHEAASRVRCDLIVTGVLGVEGLSQCLSSARLAVFGDSCGPTSRKTTLAALLAHGCPTIAVDGPQTWRDVVDAGAVILTQPNAMAMAESIRLLCANEEMRRDLSRRATEFYGAYMSVTHASAAFMAIIDRMRGVQKPFTPRRYQSSPPR